MTDCGRFKTVSMFTGFCLSIFYPPDMSRSHSISSVSSLHLCWVNHCWWVLCIRSAEHLTELSRLLYLELENSGKLRYSPLGPKAKLRSLFTCWTPHGTFSGQSGILNWAGGQRGLVELILSILTSWQERGQFICVPDGWDDCSHWFDHLYLVRLAHAHFNRISRPVFSSLFSFLPRPPSISVFCASSYMSESDDLPPSLPGSFTCVDNTHRELGDTCTGPGGLKPTLKQIPEIHHDFSTQHTPSHIHMYHEHVTGAHRGCVVGWHQINQQNS